MNMSKAGVLLVVVALTMGARRLPDPANVY